MDKNYHVIISTIKALTNVHYQYLTTTILDLNLNHHCPSNQLAFKLFYSFPESGFLM